QAPTAAECPNGPGTRVDDMTTSTLYACDDGLATAIGTGATTESGFTGSCATSGGNSCSASSSGAPAPAAAVGYNKETFGPNVTVGENWFPFGYFGVDTASIGYTQNSDGSVTIVGNTG